MSAPTLDRHPGSAQGGSPSGHRRRRRQFVLVTSALAVLVIAIGVSLAIATRPIDRQLPAEAGGVPAAGVDDQNANADQGQTAQPDQVAPSTPAAKPGSSSDPDPDPAGDGGATAALDDGDHPAYITKVDSANDRIVVDVIQVFQDDAAVKAAIADGEPPSKAKYLTGWVRNQNPRLRTLPLAGDLKVDLLGSCEETGNDRQAVLTKLAEHAKRKGNYYFALTVDDGKVERIQERLAINAC